MGRFLRYLQALQFRDQFEVVVAGSGLGKDAFLGVTVGGDHSLVAGRGKVGHGDGHILLVHRHGGTVLEDDCHDGLAPEINFLGVLAVVDGGRMARDDKVVRVGVGNDGVIRVGQESALEHEMRVIGHQEHVDVVHEGDGLAVGLGDHGAVRRGGDRRYVGGSFAGVVHGNLNLGTVHLFAEGGPPVVTGRGNAVHVQGDAVVASVVPAAPFPHIGADDEVLGIAVGTTLFRVSDSHDPVLVVGFPEGEVVELQDEFLRHRNGEVLAEIRPPGRVVVLLAHDDGGQFNGDGVVGNDIPGILLRLVCGDLLGKVVRSVDRIRLQTLTAGKSPHESGERGA